MWEWGPIKQAIEHLFMQGDLLVTRRDSFQKVFDLAERVIPRTVSTQLPTKIEYAHFLIDRHMAAHGIGHSSEFGYLRKAMGPAIKQAVIEKIESGELLQAKIPRRKENFLVNSDFESLLKRRVAGSKAKILSPFDNLVIQRKRLLRLFNFSYQLECYVPEQKRIHGYFTLPILWQNNLVARMDAKADRKHKVFIIRNFIFESKLKQKEKFGYYFAKELHKFARFNSCEEVRIGSKINKSTKQLLCS